jgi:S-adenosylmethionine:tRNA ribosyltransferase-isomerase
MPNIRKAQLSDFDYHLPEEQIAQQPLADRSASRMLVVDRRRGTWQDRAFTDFPRFIEQGDCLVLNDTKVFPARLLGHRAGFEGRAEVFLLEPISGERRTWRALVRPGRKIRTRDRVIFAPGIEVEILGRGERGERIVHFHCEGEVDQAIEKVGHIPLPLYIRRPDAAADRDRYQTVFARNPGAAAAPTAGLHFTPAILDRCRSAGASIASVTLHVGLGTFQPLSHQIVEENRLHAERYEVSEGEARKINEARRRVAIGTTSVRVLETIAQTGVLHGETALFIYPGFEFALTNAMLTNFHLPRSSLLLLVCAFAGTELTLAAYKHAVEAGYRFYSYGDCMLIV